MIKDVIDHPHITRTADALTLTALAFTAANVQTYVAIVASILAACVYATKLYDWWIDRNERRD